MTGIYHQVLNRRQIPFVVAWFIVFSALYYFIPTSWRITQAISLTCWWSVLAIGIRHFQKAKEQYRPLKPSILPLATSAMNQELYEKALEHNRERQQLFIWLWLIGLLVAIAGIYFQSRYHKMAAFLITLGLFLTSFLSKTIFPKQA